MAQFERKLKTMMNDAHLANALGLSPDVLQEVALDPVWREQAARIFDELPIRVLSVVDLASDYVRRLNVKLPDDWTQALYAWASHQLFPQNFNDDLSKRLAAVATFTMDMLGLFLDEEQDIGGFQEGIDFQDLPIGALTDSRHLDEYNRLNEAWDAYYIQEVLRLGREVQYYDLLAHVAGVHRIAVTVGAQLREAGVPVDLPLLSGAAKVHDIGKFGCRNDAEKRRMAYLHYYYTEQWCHRQNLNDIGHVAMNHSTWDLELENLSVESLLLIYSDFRVKAKNGPRGEHEEMEIYSLDDSFAVILNKLDNVDDAKRQRYQRVYNKLSDFEDFMRSYGVDVSLGERRPPEHRPAWLGTLDASETPTIFKDLAFRHNIQIMNVLGDPDYLRGMLESLRASGRAVDIRANLNIFEEYITYMTRPQKELIASYLTEMLIHPEGDIRRQAARLIGQVIAGFDERYSKWLPDEAERIVCGRQAFDLWDDVLNRVFSPDHKLGDRYRRFQGYAFQNTVASLLANLDEEDIGKFLTPLLRYYRVTDHDALTAFILLDMLTEIPVKHLSERDQRVILRFALAMIERDDVEIRLALLHFLEQFVAECKLPSDVLQDVLATIRTADTIWPGESYLIEQIEALICGGRPAPPTFKPSEVFLENLKTSTPWQVKIVNIRRLADALIDNPQMNRLHVALHFSNLLKVSEQIAVRHDAGQMLVQIAPLLTPEEVNEVVVELHRGLEMDSFEFTKYIPEYLARFAANLRAGEYDEFVYSVAMLLDVKNETVAQLALDTLAHTVAIYNEYGHASDESPKTRRMRLSVILGYIMKGLAGYHTSLRVETLSALGSVIFGNPRLSLDYKREVFDIVYKRLLMFMIDSEDDEDNREIFYGHCATLNHIYRFLAEYLFQRGKLPLYENQKVAFFPGTFDPFTLGHKEIVRTIRDKDFDVYLGLDEFSWSKNTQPAQIRRNILQMSLASEENVMLFPPIFPVNIASPEDLENLASLFKNKELYLVVGSDVVRGASAYKAPRTEHSIHGFNHIIVGRPNDGFTDQERQRALDQIDGDVIECTLPDLLEGVSSTIIRRNIDRNRDISHLIDKMAQNYIYDNNLYLGERKMKPVKNPTGVDISFIDAGGGEFWSDVEMFLRNGDEQGALSFLGAGIQPESRLVVVRDEGHLSALALVQIVSSLDIYDIVQCREIARYLREKGASRMAVISHLTMRDDNERSAQRAMVNALIWASENSATLAVYHGEGNLEKDTLAPLLDRHGFVDLPICKDDHWYRMVDMRIPILLSDNVTTLLKEPYASLPEVRDVLFTTHCRLQEALTRFHPGELVLSYDASTLEGDLAQLISRENGVPLVQGEERVLGPAMCVPYGHLLRSCVVPNTVTRPLFVQRLYQADMRNVEVTPLPYHNSVASQARVLHSFKRPIILTDEVVNRGRAFELLVPMLTAANVPIHSIACGIITGGGRDLLAELDLPYNYIHYLPNIRYWLVDSKGYPFLDGYSRADRPVHVTSGLEQSINPVLPYAAPPIFRESRVDAAWRYSQVSLQNALDIMKELETVYQRENERNLTLDRLPEVLKRPMMPDPGSSLSYDLTLNPSWYIAQDLARLDYLANIVPKEAY